MLGSCRLNHLDSVRGWGQDVESIFRLLITVLYQDLVIMCKYQTLPRGHLLIVHHGLSKLKATDSLSQDASPAPDNPQTDDLYTTEPPRPVVTVYPFNKVLIGHKIY